MSYKIAIYVIMLIFIVKKFLFVSVAARPAVPHAVHRRRGYQEQAKLHV